jgi:hypothetical protein
VKWLRRCCAVICEFKTSKVRSEPILYGSKTTPCSRVRAG